jgi:class 3 adenylate cyclase
MHVCSACGQENPEVARFCLACGAALGVAPVAAREERRVVSVIFVDLVGFTSRAERLDPEDVREILAPYHEAVRREIESFGGVVEKFIGDAVMGVFGAPTAFGDDAERAVRAALSVRDVVPRSVSHEGGLDLGLRIAVNTGEALVSLTARPALGEAMVAGDVVNTASRLQQAAPLDGVIVGEETYRATRAIVEYERAEPVAAKGKADPLEAWVALRVRAIDDEAPAGSGFVGRGHELEILSGIWERVAGECRPHLVTVLGDAGVGKSRLAAEFRKIVTELGGFTVRGRTLPYRESSAYGAFASQLKQLCGVYESDSPDAALAKVRATVETMIDGPSATEIADHLAILIGLAPAKAVEDRETLFFSVRVFIEAVARNRPALLVFEDLHWADSSLLDLVELLGARLRDLPIMILVLARPELLDTRPAWGGGLPAYMTLPLGPLAEEEARELAAQRLGPLAELDRAAGLAETGAGNPLFIEQLAAALSEGPAAAGDALPTTIKGILAARLDALPPDERSLLLEAAVSGKVFWRGALTESERLSGLLGALEGRDLIRRETVSAIEGTQQFSFTHVLIRDVAYDLLPRARRRELHEAVARFLEATTAEVGEAGTALARHWRDAGNPERAFDYFFVAGERAEQGWAKDRAVILYREALELAAEHRERRGRVLRRLAVAEQAVYHLPDARLLGLGSD